MPENPSPTATKTRRNPFKSLWFWVVLAFVLLISAWSTLIYVAANNRPEVIELEQAPATTGEINSATSADSVAE